MRRPASPHLLLALTLLAPAARAEPGAPLAWSCRIAEVRPLDGAPPTLAVRCGAPLEVELPARGQVFAGLGADAGQLIAAAELTTLADGTGEAQVMPTPSPPAEGLAPGAYLRIWTRPPAATWRGGALLDLQALDIVFADNALTPFTTAAELLAATDDRVEARVLAAMRAAGGAAAEQARAYPAPLPGDATRHAGEALHAALAATSDDDVNAFLDYALAYPVTYFGTTHRFTEVYATWLINGAPAAPDRVARLVSAARTRIAAAEEAWAAGDRARARAEHLRAIAAWDASGDAVGLADALVALARHEKKAGAFAVARPLLERALALRRALRDNGGVADALWELGDGLLVAREATPALRAFEEAARLYHRLRRDADEGMSLCGVATARAILGDAKETIAATKRSVAAMKRFGDPLGLAIAWLMGATNHRDVGDPAGARRAYEQVLKVAPADAPVRVEALAGLADQAIDAGDIAAATQYGNDARDICSRLSGRVQCIEALRVVQRIAFLQADFPRAEELARERVALAREIGTAEDLAYALRQLAWMLTSLGRLREALVLADEALPITEAPGLEVERAWTLATRGRVLGYRGEALASRQALDLAVGLLEAHGLPNDRARMRFNRALDRIHERDLEGALADLDGARALVVGRVDAEFDVALRLGRGSVLHELGREAEAEAQLLAALRLARTGAVHRVPGAMRLLAQIQASTGHVDRAIATLREAAALALAERGEAATGAVADLGVVQARAGRVTDATATLDGWLARARKTEGGPSWEPLYWLGRLRADAGRGADAVALLREAVADIERGEVVLDDDAARARYFADKLDVYRTLIRLLLSEGKVDEGLRYLERARLAELHEVERRGGGPPDPATELLTELDVQEARLQALLDKELAAAPPDATRVGRLDGLLADVRRRRAGFLEGVDRNDAAFDRYAIRPLALEQLQQRLPLGVLVLAPVLLDDRLVVFAVTRTALTHFTAAVGPDEVRALVDGFIADVDPRRAEGAQGVAGLARVRAKAGRLYDLLVRPAFDALGVPQTLVVSAMGSLRYVPFAALWDGDRWLVERTLLVSATSLDVEAFAAPAAGDLRDASILALVDPDGTLPGARAEELGIERAYPGAVTTLEGAEATLAALRGKIRVPGFDIIHLATHGRLDAATPEASHIVLADGQLAYDEIPTLAPKKTRLVVLSACQTAVHAGGSGVEIAGLAYQFKRSAVSRVVATLWEVDDDATAALMERFYVALRRGDGFAAALASAQRALLSDGEGLGLAHPAYWAPFFLMGPP